MKQSRFTFVAVVVVVALVLLASVEAMWAVGNYRDLKANYRHQIESILDEAIWQYTEGRKLSQGFSIGPIDRFHTFVGYELRSAGISTHFMVEVLTTTNAEPIRLMSMGGESLGEERMDTAIILVHTTEEVTLLIAAMSAEGVSTIQNIEQIDRGYRAIDERLNALGAKILRINE